VFLGMTNKYMVYFSQVFKLMIVINVPIQVLIIDIVKYCSVY
jgi:hypothetical protein